MDAIDPQRILVVEDDEALRDAVVRILNKARDWSAEGVGTLREGLANLSAAPPVAVVLDLGLPDTHGLEGLGRIRQAHPLVAVVVMTGRSDEATALQALALGAQEYLVKGQWDQQGLQRTVRYAIERKRAERNILNASLLLAATLDAFRSAIAIIGRDGRIFATNLRWREASDQNPFVHGLGAGSDYLALCRAYQAVEHRGSAVVAEGVLAVAEGRLPTFKAEYPTAETPPQWYALTVTGFRIEGGMHLLVTVANTTEQVQLTAEMRRHQHLFKLISDHSTDLIAIVDRTGKRLYESPSYERSLGWTHEELDAMAPLSLLHPEDVEPVRRAVDEVFRTGSGREVVYRMRTKEGAYRTFESHAAAVRDPQGGSEAALFSARDITAKKAAEEARDSLETQLRSAQKLESIGQLAAGIAHEINTPIQYIGDNTRFLRESFDEFIAIISRHRVLFASLDLASMPAEQMRELASLVRDSNFEYLIGEIPRAAEETLEGVARVANIIKALKEFSYPVGEDPVMMDVNRRIETTLIVARNEWKYHAEVVTELDAELPAVPGFPGEFNQVILNLVVNGAHAIQDALKDRGEEKGRITLRTRREGEYVLVEVADSGKGIPAEIRGRVFDPFFTTKGVGKGTGQGLSIAHTVMEKHQGSIRFESETGVGTTFLLRLPLRRADEPAKEAIG